jgi:sodium-dependent phosphate cotransporter
MLTFNVLLPFASGIISTIFAVLVFRRYAAHSSAGRRGAHLLLWGIGMVFYAIGGYCEAYYGAFGWSSLVFRLWYLCGAILVAAWLGQGTVYLLAKRRLANVLMILLAIAVIFVTLTFITKNMKVLVAARIERTLNAALARSGLVGMVVGTIVTVAVQSSSITTSILIPLVASGILAVRNAFPITLGANVGTTITALLAALGAGKVDGLTIAVTHTLFNLAGILLLYPWSRIRYLPVAAADRLATLAIRHKTAALGYTAGFFVILPIVGIFVFR